MPALLVPLTVAENCRDWPPVKVTEVGLIDTETPGKTVKLVVRVVPFALAERPTVVDVVTDPS
jgi:hypothetical protein